MKNILKKLLFPFQFILAIGFIIYEEIIWEQIAEPLGEYLQSLKVLQKIESFILTLNSYLILLIFVSLFVGVELVGLSAGILLLKGMPLTGLMLYALKIPIAGFTFWLFRISKTRLLAFSWFKLIYKRVQEFLEWIKTREIYQDSLAMLILLKQKIKNIVVEFRESNSSNWVLRRTKALYRLIKRVLRLD